MILNTMTPEEKVREMKKMVHPVLDVAYRWLSKNYKTWKRVTVYPSYFTFEHDFEGMGKWTVVIVAENKSYIKKGIVCIKCYQEYYVTHAKDHLNNGKGIYILKSDDEDNFGCVEYTPHFFNRFRERYCKPRGLNPSFSQLVILMEKQAYFGMDVTYMNTTFVPDGKGHYVFVEDNSKARQDGYSNLISYHKEGLNLGIAAAMREYFCYLTYVSNNELYQSQIDKQRKMLEEYSRIEFQKRSNPFKRVDYEHFRFETI